MQIAAPASGSVPGVKAFTKYLCVLVVLTGTIVLLGWIFDIRSLETVLPGLASMKVNTALCLVLGGISLWLLGWADRMKPPPIIVKQFGVILALIVLAVSAATLGQYLFGMDFRIDQALFKDALPDGHSAPGRMGPNTALSFFAMGIALLLHSSETKRGRRPAHFVVLIPALISLIAMIGYLYSEISFYRISSYTGMALHTAVALFVLSWAILLSPPDRGMSAIIFADTVGGVVVRRLLPAAIIVPVVLGWLRLEGQKAGLYGADLGLALAVTLNIAIFSTMVYISGVYIHVTSLARQNAEESLQRSFERLSTLHEIDQEILAEQSPEGLISAALERIQNLIPFDRANVVFFDVAASVGLFFLARGSEELGPANGSSFPIAAFSPLEILKRPATRYLADLKAEVDRPPLLERLMKDGVRSLLSAPLIADNELIGELSLAHRQPNAFSSEHKDIVQDLATQLAVGVHQGKLRESLRKSNKTLESIIDASPLPIVVLDKRANVLIWSRAAERVFGWTENEVIGRASPAIPDEKREEFQSILQTLQLGEAIAPLETVRINRDGAQIPVSLWAAPYFDEKGEISGEVAILEDVGERKRLESQLRQALKMEAVGQLAGGVAHDFNNILGVIIGHCELRLEDLDAGNALGKSIHEIRRAAERAAGLTRQLLAFSRKQIIQPKVLDLNSIVVDVEKMLRRLIGENIEFSTSLHPALRTVKADAGQIEQVIMNLAVNARDAMPDGGKLTIETANVEIDEAFVRHDGVMQPGSYVMLACTDTGIGMDAQTQSKIFEPFFTTKGTGTGLGLSTVYGIVKHSLGFVWVYSELGKGTTIKVYFPKVDAPAELVNTPIQSAPKGGSERILVVEDEDSLRELACEFLQRAGYSVLAAGDVQQALDISQRHSEHIDLLLTDVVLPGGSGYALAQEMKRHRSALKVLYVSGYPDEAIARHGVLESGIAFLQKPYARGALTRKVRDVLDQITQLVTV